MSKKENVRFSAERGVELSCDSTRDHFLCVTAKMDCHVRFGSIATDEVEVTRSRMSASPLKAGNLHTISASPLSAISRQMQCSKQYRYSITSSASASTLGGMLSPSALAVFRLMTKSYFVGSVTGRSDAFAPLRMRPA